MQQMGSVTLSSLPFTLTVPTTTRLGLFGILFFFSCFLAILVGCHLNCLVPYQEAEDELLESEPRHWVSTEAGECLGLLQELERWGWFSGNGSVQVTAKESRPHVWLMKRFHRPSCMSNGCWRKFSALQPSKTQRHEIISIILGSTNIPSGQSNYVLGDTPLFQNTCLFLLDTSLLVS